jgi:hypothetical protein
MTQTDQLLARLKRLAEKTGRTPKALASQVLGSSAEIERLEQGGTMTLAKYDRVNARLDELERAQ